MSLSRAIVRAWMAIDRAQIPACIQSTTRLHILDAVGVGLAAAVLEQGEPYRRFAGETTGHATALTGVRLADASMAALINGGLIHSLEFDDTHTASIVHGSAVLAPVAIAVAETAGRSFDDAIRSYLLGYEVLIRIGLAAPGAFQARGFQITPVGGALVAALVAADLMGASEDQRVHACGIALSQASGVFEFLTNGSTVKSLHPGWAAHAGVIAAKLAMSGMTGPETALEGARGLFVSFAGTASAAEQLTSLARDLGSRWHIEDVAFKFLPCCHYLHPFVEAAGLLAGRGVTADRIEGLMLRIAAGASGIVCEPWAAKQAPPDAHAARWSLPIVVAARFVDGRVDLATFQNPASADILALAGRSDWEPLEPNNFPRTFEAEIVAKLVDGTSQIVRIDDVFGNASRPPRQVDIVAKFRANAALCLTASAVALLERVILSEAQTIRLFAEAISHTSVRCPS